MNCSTRVLLLITLNIFPLLSACMFVAQSNEPEHRPAITPYMSEPAILVFSKTSDWRHNEGIAAGNLFFVKQARKKGFGIFTTENAAVFNREDLARFEVIVFNNISGDVFTLAQQKAFRDWMENGGAWIGIHCSGAETLEDWGWYREQLIGAKFIGHPMEPRIQTGNLVVLAQEHPIVSELPAQWSQSGEWYSFSQAPDSQRFTLLLGIDESTYHPTNRIIKRWEEDLRMGPRPINHPLIWARCTNRYRAVYSALGDSDLSFEEEMFKKILDHAFDWVTQTSSACSYVAPKKL